MLYQTYQNLSISPSPTSSSLCPKEMESVELKNCSRKTGGEDFSVDDLLDFSNDDVFVDDDEAAELKTQRKKGVSSPSLNDGNTLHGDNNDEDSLSLHTSELAIPMDDLAELEWLSNFVDDSPFTLYSAPARKNKPDWLTGIQRHPAPPVSAKPPLPVNSRTKRSRTGNTTGWSHLLNDSSSSSSSSSDTSAPPQFLSGGTEFLDEPMVKKQKKKTNKKKSLEISETELETQQPRRCCSHCGSKTTPQWRAGPTGPKTLCNACGVRYKSGRLLPEYRPAASPMFSKELHSNSHRKVIEMRKKKEMSGEQGDETGLNQTVQTVEVVPSF